MEYVYALCDVANLWRLESFEIKPVKIADVAADITSEHFQCQKAGSSNVAQQTAC